MLYWACPVLLDLQLPRINLTCVYLDWWWSPEPSELYCLWGMGDGIPGCQVHSHSPHWIFSMLTQGPHSPEALGLLPLSIPVQYLLTQNEHHGNLKLQEGREVLIQGNKGVVGSQTRPVQECLGVCHLDPSLSYSARSYWGWSSNSEFPRHSLQQWMILVGRITCWFLVELKEFDHLGGETWKEVEDIGKIEQCDMLHNKIGELQIVLGA